MIDDKRYDGKKYVPSIVSNSTHEPAEPLSAEIKHWRELCERVVMYVKRPEAVGIGESNAFLVNVLFPIAVKFLATPAAPRTQGREPAYDYPLFVSDWLGEHGEYFGYLADMLQDFHALVAAQPQPAPRPPVCPKCGSPASIYWMIGHHEGKCNGVDCGYSSVHWEQFFTAIPAQK